MGFLTDKPTSFTEDSSGLIQPLKGLTDGRRHGGRKILSWNPKLHCIGSRPAGTFEGFAEKARRALRNFSFAFAFTSHLLGKTPKKIEREEENLLDF